MIDVALLSIIRRWHLRDQVSLREIARRLGVSRNTVRKYLRTDTTEPNYSTRRTPSALDSYAFKLSVWLKTEANKPRKQRRTLKQIHADLCSLGFNGSYDRVAAFARQWKVDQLDRVKAASKGTLVALNVEDLTFVEHGVMVHIRKSKTDQQAIGAWLAVPSVNGRYCPCNALKAWIEAAGITTGPLFLRLSRYGTALSSRLTAQSVALIIKARARAIGLNPEKLSGHSLRAGFATEAACVGVESFKIRAQTRHGSDAMLNRYIRPRELFKGSPITQIWKY